MSQINVLEEKNQTIKQMIEDCSFGGFTETLLIDHLIEGLSLNMDSAKVLVGVIKDNDMNESNTIKTIVKILERMNDGGIDYRIRLNQILGYLYSFAEGNNKINGIVDMRKKDLDTILSKPKPTI